MIVRTHVRRLAAIAAAVVAIVVVATASATAGERLADLLAGDQRVGPYGEIYQRDGTVLLRGDVTISFDGNENTPAQLADYRLVADEEGMPLADAIDRYAWQEEFAEVTNRLAQTFPDEYAGARIVGDGLSAWIGFRAEVPALAADLVDSLPKPVELVRGRGFTQDELIAALEQSYYKVYRWPDIANAAGTVDIETGVITIEAEPSTELGFVQREQLRAALTQAPGPNPAITLRLIVVDELPAYETEGHMRGGAYFSPSQSRSAPGRCTTGFSVRTSTNSARGVATAGHCAQSVVRRHYQNHGSSSWSSYGREAWHVGTHGDVGWYGRHANPLPQFFSSWNGIRLVTANRAASEGQRLWVFGTTSGQRSAIVDATGNCIAGMCNLVAMDRDVTAGGDSGGPWFTGNTAVGIHSGVYASRSHFTPTFTLSSRHGLVVLRA